MKTSDALSLINGKVRAIKPYHLVPEEVSIKLNQNENPFDWPESVKKEAARFCLERPWNRYPPFIPDKLKGLLAEYTGVTPQSIIVGNGSNEMLLVLLMALVNKASRVIICQPTFTVYRLLVEATGGEVISIKLTDNLQYDVPAISDAAKDAPGSLLILCSPNNPTGNTLSEKDLRVILDQHTGFCILDQAYIEFGGYNGMQLLDEYKNLIITRTFSKAFAGAGIRLGYMVGAPEIISEINKVKLPYNINFFSEFVASLLLEKREHIKESITVSIYERDLLLDFLKSKPFDNVYPSAANFILVRTKIKKALFDSLKSNDILVRDVSSYPMLDNCLRISVGTPEENNLLKDAITMFFSASH